jgi:flagellar basal-body rod modification protein FlgD
MPVDATTSSNNAANVVAYSTTNTRQPRQQLGSEDFMKLLAVQFQSQDPMKPMEDTAFIAQMAQFSALENSNTLSKEMGLLRADQQNLAANGMLGRTVTVTDADGNPVIGEVSAVTSTAKGPALIVNGEQYDLSTVTRIENTPVAADLPPAA